MNWRALRRPLGLRARLTLSYALFFGLLLLAVGWFFRQTLRTIQLRDAEALLAEDWAAAKGYLAIREGRVGWSHNRKDQEVDRVIKNLQAVFLLAEPSGQPLLMSEAYRALNVEDREVAGWLDLPAHQDQLRRDRHGVLHLIRAGPHEAGRQKYLLSIGRSLEANERILSEFTQTYFTGVPLLILLVAALGWLAAGRALAPLREVAEASRALSGENLGVRLHPRGSGDEIDGLIGAFNAMADRLENSFNQVRQFSVDASHELRTPLTAIRSQLEVALLTARETAQYREAIVTAIEDADQLSLVVKALLQLAQAESGQVAVASEPVALRELVSRVVEQFQIPAEADEIRLAAELEECSVTGDAVQLRRMIYNLLSNALIHTPRSGQVNVTLRPVPAAGLVELIVADTGRGIQPEHLPHIFERFYRVPAPNQAGARGLGLGLSFVSWIAKVHAARIEVTSEPGRGTRFSVLFPAREPEREAGSPGAHAAEAAAGAPASPSAMQVE